MKRRTLVLGGSAIVGAGAVLGGAALSFGRVFADRPRPGATRQRLEPDPRRILDLAPGFSYSVVDRQLERMDDGYRVPRRPDGMACFTAASGAWVLLRNHELTRAPADADYLEGRALPSPYDPQMFGGVTRVELEPSSLRRLRTNLVLTGTSRNCAGGVSPWGWLTCEESTEPGHGYVFACSVEAREAAPPQKIAAYGRCRREAAAVDPATNIAYLTEDEVDSCFYRFVPHAKDRPFEGRLEALCVTGRPRFNTARAARQGEALPVSWVALDDPEAQRETLREQAQARGAALIRRAEGLWLDRRRAYICSSTGGPAEAGQIFVLELDAPGSLSLLTESVDRERLDMPDNITVGPSGVLYLIEDGPGADYLRALLPDGTLLDIARNAASEGEMAGCCFSPDGRVLFANLQEDGITVAIRGPFPG
ncbi:MAG: alkaline phosphatase PhoX [Polyangiaceae bacterium]